MACPELKVIGFILCAVIAANAGLSVFNRFGNSLALEEHDTSAGTFFATISVFYSLLLGFNVIVEWHYYSALSKTIASESDKLNNILTHSLHLPETVKKKIDNSLFLYCKQVVEQEWAMHERRTAIDNPSAIPALRQLLLTTDPGNQLQENILKVMDNDLSVISDLRRDRLNHTHSQLPNLVWRVLEVGAVILIIFSYFFKSTYCNLHRVYLSFLACLLAMCFSIIYNLDHPFSPGSGLDNGSYKKILSELKTY